MEQHTSSHALPSADQAETILRIPGMSTGAHHSRLQPLQRLCLQLQYHGQVHCLIFLVGHATYTTCPSG